MTEAILYNLINVPLWDKAKWKGVAFIVDLSGKRVPVIAFVFRHGQYGQQIFTEWIQVIGETDEYDILRLSIIEGDIPGEEAGYSVHVSVNPGKIIYLAATRGIDLESNAVITVSRIHRMNPEPGSENLPLFKRSYSNKDAYLIAPASIESGRVKVHFELAIAKATIIFRHVDDVTESDVDSVIFLSNGFDA